MRFSVIDVPGKVKVPARLVCAIISVLLILLVICREKLKRFSDEFFALLPKRLSIVWIESISAHAFADGGYGRVGRHDLAHVAVLAISAADLVGGCNHTGPHGCCGS